MATTADALLAWFRAARRELPWRTAFPRDPYAVLVSEVMAQQTQIGRVAAAYSRFMQRFPTLESLAAAGEDEVVHAFSGLGYYRRARLLHAAARAVAVRGGWPTGPADLRALPGFGAYTSAAVAAFSFAGREAPVDGNVARVAARVGGLPLAMGSAPLLAAAREIAQRLFDEAGTPEVWEALMELGATVCTPAAPRCHACPLSAGCTGFREGTPQRYPLPRRQRAPEAHRWAALWVERGDGRVLLRRVDGGAVLSGLWLPPFRELAPGTDAAAAATAMAAEAGLDVRLSPAPPVRHSITHRRIEVLPFTCRLTTPRVAETADGWSWQDWRAPAVPTSSLLAKLGAACAAPTAGAGEHRVPAAEHSKEA
ncbi:MAG TPA: NUDIX domain-containing protein [Thermoanaerobaculaceae bacterium]|nr:NUDIX domain-containing protein [Thermoanaerobaculaceae bacterium]